MKLYMVPLAPNPTKVMLYIVEREQSGVDLGIEQVMVNTLKGQHREPAHLARNPFGTLPALELDDGSFLVESLAIIEYLEDRYPDQGLLDASPEVRARQRDIERICDLRIGTPMNQYVHAVKSPLGLPPAPEKAAKIREDIAVGLDYLEALLSDNRPFLTGRRVSVADCTLQASLQFLRFIEADLIENRPLLRDWDTRYRDRPAARSELKW